MKTRFIKEIGRIVIPYGEKHEVLTRFVFPGVFDAELIKQTHTFEFIRKFYPQTSSIKYAPLYDNETGEPMIGDLFFEDWLPETMFWDNHKGGHLCVILPNGETWNIDSKASNCTMPKDRLHRCWCRTGDPRKGEIVDVTKSCVSCSAGAGSIQSGNYHGFLKNGELILA